MLQTEARPQSRRTRGIAPPLVIIVAVAIAVGAYYAAAGLLLHLSFHSYGWDLGIFDQVLWNTAHGRPFAYSFREMSYLGDHFQPVLLLLVPLVWLGAGPAPLLIVQGAAFGAACIPLFAAVRRLAGAAPAWMITGAYVLGLAQARAVTYDFHPEAFIPVLAFTSLWGLAARRTGAFMAGALGLLIVKEDAAFLTLSLCWVAWFAFGLRREAAITAGTAIAYAAAVMVVIQPHFAGGDLNPMRERYAYLGDNAPEIALNAVIRPDLIIEHLAHRNSPEAVFLVLAGAGMLPLLTPRLWPPLAALIVLPFLSTHGAQRDLIMHYMVAPATIAMVLAVVALRSPALDRLGPLLRRLPGLGRGITPATAGAFAALALAVAIFVWKSPLPPSPAGDASRYRVDSHSRLAESFTGMVPRGVPVSAQATYVPHLSHREDIYEFPRVLNAEWVLLDAKRDVPGYDWPHYGDCLAELPSLGFEPVRQEDGITLWHRVEPGGEAEHCE